MKRRSWAFRQWPTIISAFYCVCMWQANKFKFHLHYGQKKKFYEKRTRLKYNVRKKNESNEFPLINWSEGFTESFELFSTKNSKIFGKFFTRHFDGISTVIIEINGCLFFLRISWGNFVDIKIQRCWLKCIPYQVDAKHSTQPTLMKINIILLLCVVIVSVG